MALTTDRQEIWHTPIRLERAPSLDVVDELNRRLDALVDALEIIAREQYDFPGLPESKLRSALNRARRA